MLRSDCESVVQEARGKAGDDRYELASIKEKMKTCGVELMAWGSSITDSNAAAIKELQKTLDVLNEAEPTKANKVEFLN